MIKKRGGDLYVKLARKGGPKIETKVGVWPPKKEEKARKGGRETETKVGV